MKLLQILSLLILFQSCAKKTEVLPIDCPEYVNLGIFSLADSSAYAIPYSETTNRLVFSDQSGNEYIAEMISYDHVMTADTSEVLVPCKEDRTQSAFPIETIETKTVSFHFSELDLQAEMHIWVDVMKINSNIFLLDNLDVKVFHLSDPVLRKGRLATIRINKRTSPFHDETIPEPFKFINDTEFKDVFLTPFDFDFIEYNLYYNYKDGLIGVEKRDGSLTLKFERVE